MRPAPGKPARSPDVDEWVRGWRSSGRLPCHIEEHKYSYVICDTSGTNIASRPGGAVLFWKPNRHLAEMVLEHLKTRG